MLGRSFDVCSPDSLTRLRVSNVIPPSQLRLKCVFSAARERAIHPPHRGSGGNVNGLPQPLPPTNRRQVRHALAPHQAQKGRFTLKVQEGWLMV